MTRKILAIIAAAICTLAITATAFAAEFINADQARSIAAQWVPAGSTHLVTKDESHKYAAYYEVKFTTTLPTPNMKLKCSKTAAL